MHAAIFECGIFSCFSYVTLKKLNEFMKMTQLVRCLSFKHAGLSLNPQTHIKARHIDIY